MCEEKMRRVGDWVENHCLSFGIDCCTTTSLPLLHLQARLLLLKTEAPISVSGVFGNAVQVAYAVDLRFVETALLDSLNAMPPRHHPFSAARPRDPPFVELSLTTLRVCWWPCVLSNHTRPVSA